MVNKVPKSKGRHSDRIGIRDGGVSVFYGLISILQFESFSFGFYFFFFIPSCGRSVEAVSGAAEFSGEAWKGLWEPTGIHSPI